MREIVCVLIVAIALLIFEVEANAQQTKKIPRIGILGSSSVSGAERSRAIRHALAELGYIDGQNVAIEERFRVTEGHRGNEFAVELVRLEVDVIVVAGGNNVVQAAIDATKTIPIVLIGQGTDPVVAGFVRSLARPGGNVTGLSNLSTHLGGKRLELFKQAVPKLVRIAVLYDPAQPGGARERRDDLPPAASALGLSLRHWEVRRVEDFEPVFAALSNDRPDGLFYMSAGGMMRDHEKRGATLALKNRLPSAFGSRAAAEGGGLIAYGADLRDSYRRVAIYVDKILKGARPADLPVEQPTKFELVINLKTAKQIGLTIPPNVLARADRVIR